jgi:hypothetical protein
MPTSQIHAIDRRKTNRINSCLLDSLFIAGYMPQTCNTNEYTTPLETFLQWSHWLACRALHEAKCAFVSEMLSDTSQVAILRHLHIKRAMSTENGNKTKQVSSII